MGVDKHAASAAPLTAHVGYQLFKVGYDVLLSVEPSCLDEPHRAAGSIKVGRRCTGDKGFKVGEVLVAPR
jgi:hypothetical protein